MKVLFVSPTFYEYPHRIGGAETYVHSLAEALAQLPAVRRVGLLSFSQHKTGIWTKNKVHYDIRRATFIQNNPSNPVPWITPWTLLGWDVIYLQQFHTWLTFWCLFWGKVLGKKVVLTDHNGGGTTYNRRLHIDRALDLFLTTSELSFKEINLEPKAATAIYGGVDLKIYHPKTIKKSGILFVGRAHPIKGILPFLESAVKAQTTIPITLALAVNFENEAYFQKIVGFVAQNRGLNINIQKNLPQEGIIHAYQTHQWTVLPSIDEAPHESLGLTMLESLACDTPVAVTPFCGIAELLSKEPQPFIHLLKDHSVFFQLAKTQEANHGARVWAEKNLSWEKVAEYVYQALKNLFKKEDDF